MMNYNPLRVVMVIIIVVMPAAMDVADAEVIIWLLRAITF